MQIFVTEGTKSCQRKNPGNKMPFTWPSDYVFLVPFSKLPILCIIFDSVPMLEIV